MNIDILRKYGTVEQCYTQYVSDSLSASVLNNWCSESPKTGKLIVAPTGCGKNYFIEHTLLSFAYEQQKTVLLVTNRSALDYQIKARLESENPQSAWTFQMKHISLKSDAESAQLVSMIPKDFSESESVWKRYLSRSLPPLKVYVTKYQNLLSLLKILQERIDFVVFDEVHFFTSDAMFNCKTGYILAKSLTLLNNAVQIYMSATPEEILAPIRALTSLTIYYFPPQKRNDTCFYYQKTEELIPYIEASPSNEQWLIFVNSKQNGKQLQKMLSAKYGASEISYLDANAKETNAWSEIVSQDSFSGKVLICTSVLDNGINLKDSSGENKICHIVLPACEHTTFMQMLGRKRISPHANDSIKLYIQSISAMELQSHKRRLKRMQDAVWEWINLFNHPEYVPVHPWDALLSMPICSLQNYIPNQNRLAANEFSHPFLTHPLLKKYWYHSPDFVRRIFYVAVVPIYDKTSMHPVKTTTLSLNRLVIDRLCSQEHFYGELSKLMEEDTQSAFPRLAMQWLGLDYHQGAWLKIPAFPFLLQSIDHYKDIAMSISEFNILADQIISEYCKQPRCNRKNMKIKNDGKNRKSDVNKILAHYDLPYQIMKRKNLFTFVETCPESS